MVMGIVVGLHERGERERERESERRFSLCPWISCQEEEGGRGRGSWFLGFYWVCSFCVFN